MGLAPCDGSSSRGLVGPLCCRVLAPAPSGVVGLTVAVIMARRYSFTHSFEECVYRPDFVQVVEEKVELGVCHVCEAFPWAHVAEA
jgi:hypothetical protein